MLKQFKEALRDAGRRDSFDRLVRAWSSEMGAMTYAMIPTVLSVMLLSSVVDNRKEILILTKMLETLNKKLEKIEKYF